MPLYEIALIFRWLVPLWALGWLVLPFSARLFPFLPDKGLAAGRVMALLLTSVLCFWGAAIHLLPMSLAPLIFIVAPLWVARDWKDEAFRKELAANRRALLCSDLVFLLAFGAFLWVRLRHPDTSDLEKPMDVALIASALRTSWLPFENPWFAGNSFTNYYYFGPLMSSFLARTLFTPPQYAYNLAQPLFCTLFLSTTWSLTSALTKSLKLGLLAMLLVCVGGHFEPLRQISQTHTLWPLDWWKTSRVIEDTINEYPAFTLLVGDLHAHFYAFCLAIVHFCLCYAILKARSAEARAVRIVLGGVFLGVFAITNTWDVPFYGLLWLGCVIWSHRKKSWEEPNDFSPYVAFLTGFLIAVPYFIRFKSQVHGVVFNPWVPNLLSFALFWGGWWVVGLAALCFEPAEKEISSEVFLRRLLIVTGVLTLLFPYVFYIRGVFGDGDLRHQDTVFKFGLQAWLLLGVGLASEAGARVQAWWSQGKPVGKWVLGGLGTVFFAILALAPVCVAYTRAVGYGERDAEGNPIYSLNAAQFLPAGDQEGIEWLRSHAQEGESVIEAVKGDWDANYGRVSSLSGVPCYLNWPQHVAGWGDYGAQIPLRTTTIQSVFQLPDPLPALQTSGATYVFQGFLEPKVRENAHLKSVWKSTDGTTQILRFQP